MLIPSVSQNWIVLTLSFSLLFKKKQRSKLVQLAGRAIDAAPSFSCFVSSLSSPLSIPEESLSSFSQKILVLCVVLLPVSYWPPKSFLPDSAVYFLILLYTVEISALYFWSPQKRFLFWWVLNRSSNKRSESGKKRDASYFWLLRFDSYWRFLEMRRGRMILNLSNLEKVSPGQDETSLENKTATRTVSNKISAGISSWTPALGLLQLLIFEYHLCFPFYFSIQHQIFSLSFQHLYNQFFTINAVFTKI